MTTEYRLTLRQLLKEIHQFIEFNGDEILDFEIATHGPDGRLRLPDCTLSIAEPDEKLLGLCIDGFALREDLEVADADRSDLQ